MNGNFRDNSIGTDPTNIPVIETLDVVPKNANQKKDGKDKIKKILFTVIIILLMFGVAGGLYYYLNLGQKNKKTSSFTLLEKSIVVGQELSSDIKDYGEFNNIDISSCSIDLSNVDNSNAGQYKYSVKCYKTQKESIINVISFNTIKASTLLTYKVKGSNVTYKSFVKVNDGLTYKFVNESDAILNESGLKSVAIDVYDEDDNHERVYGVVNVIDSEYLLVLNCTKEKETNKIVIDYNQKKIGNIVRINEITYLDESSLLGDISKINSGKVSINDYSGYVTVDYEQLKLSIINTVSEDIPNSYAEIKTYYTQKGYTCK